MKYYHYKQSGLAGECEVCKGYTGNLIYEREERDYTREDGTEGTTQYRCENRFICEKCKRA